MGKDQPVTTSQPRPQGGKFELPNTTLDRVKGLLSQAPPPSIEGSAKAQLQERMKNAYAPEPRLQQELHKAAEEHAKVVQRNNPGAAAEPAAGRQAKPEGDTVTIEEPREVRTTIGSVHTSPGDVLVADVKETNEAKAAELRNRAIFSNPTVPEKMLSYQPPAPTPYEPDYNPKLVQAEADANKSALVEEKEVKSETSLSSILSGFVEALGSLATMFKSWENRKWNSLADFLDAGRELFGTIVSQFAQLSQLASYELTEIWQAFRAIDLKSIKGLMEPIFGGSKKEKGKGVALRYNPTTRKHVADYYEAIASGDVGAEAGLLESLRESTAEEGGVSNADATALATAALVDRIPQPLRDGLGDLARGSDSLTRAA